MKAECVPVTDWRCVCLLQKCVFCHNASSKFGECYRFRHTEWALGALLTTTISFNCSRQTIRIVSPVQWSASDFSCPHDLCFRIFRFVDSGCTRMFKIIEPLNGFEVFFDVRFGLFPSVRSPLSWWISLLKQDYPVERSPCFWVTFRRHRFGWSLLSKTILKGVSNTIDVYSLKPRWLSRLVT